MHEIGFMQGRLVPQIDGRIQAFPWQRWREEFTLARSHGFQSIEFIFETERYRENPLYESKGRAELKELIARSEVPVSAICADYFMDHPFFGISPTAQSHSVELLSRLIDAAADIGARRVEIPCVDHASLRTEEDKRQVVEAVGRCLGRAEQADIEVVFETSLPPEEFRDFLLRFRHPLIKANFDSGNSASLGYEPVHELRALGNLISNIHIKDRLLHGTTVPLGTGNADFPAIFSTLAEIRYQGPFILQTARDPDDVGVALRYRDLVKSYLAAHFT
jgi:hexulose-6-phosphate isomerase